MIVITVPLQLGTSLSNVRYKWLVNGVWQSEQSSGITQPSTDFPEFRFNVSPPAGAEEMIAYDVTDLGNWNPAGYLRLLTVPPQPVISPPIVTTYTGRLVKFRSVYESIIRRLGYNPRQPGEPKEDVALNVLEHINNRVRFAWSVWDWPDINLVEWRAFRTIWNGSSIIFKRGDELYYLGDGVTVPAANVDPPAPGANAGYYTCTADAPQGTVPTNTNYFSPLDLVDRYIAYSQTHQNVIGELLDVYKINPREKRLTKTLRFYPSSRGIDIWTGLDIVWIRFKIPCAEFTLTPALPGVTSIGTKFYDPASGDCYMITATLDGPDVLNSSTLIPFPFFLAGYVRAAVYSDTILDTTTGDASVRMALSQQANAEAEMYLQREIDALATQGQRFQYTPFPSRHKRYLDRPHVGSGAIPVETFGGFGT